MKSLLEHFNWTDFDLEFSFFLIKQALVLCYQKNNSLFSSNLELDRYTNSTKDRVYYSNRLKLVGTSWKLFLCGCCYFLQIVIAHSIYANTSFPLKLFTLCCFSQFRKWHPFKTFLFSDRQEKNQGVFRFFLLCLFLMIFALKIAQASDVLRFKRIFKILIQQEKLNVLLVIYYCWQHGNHPVLLRRPRFF